MSFSSNDLVSSYVARIRLLVGDISEFPLLEDGVYEYLYLQNNNNEHDAAIDGLESIITMLTVNPPDINVGDYTSSSIKIADYERTLARLKSKLNQDSQKVKAVPMLARTDRVNWDDINSIFNKE